MPNARYGKLLADGSLELAPEGARAGYKPVIGDPSDPPKTPAKGTPLEFVRWDESPVCIFPRWRMPRPPRPKQGETK